MDGGAVDGIQLPSTITPINQLQKRELRNNPTYLNRHYYLCGNVSFEAFLDRGTRSATPCL